MEEFDRARAMWRGLFCNRLETDKSEFMYVRTGAQCTSPVCTGIDRIAGLSLSLLLQVGELSVQQFLLTRAEHLHAVFVGCDEVELPLQALQSATAPKAMFA